MNMNNLVYLGINNKSGVTANAYIRKAISLAVDREVLVKVLTAILHKVHLPFLTRSLNFRKQNFLKNRQTLTPQNRQLLKAVFPIYP